MKEKVVKIRNHEGDLEEVTIEGEEYKYKDNEKVELGKLFYKETMELQEKQVLFCNSLVKTTLYGGAAGGGKSHVLRLKLVLMACSYSGIQIMLMRKTIGEVLNNHKLHMQRLTVGLAKFVGGTFNELRFWNGSVIYFGFCSHKEDLLKYQGNSYEIIAIDEAGNFEYEWYEFLASRNRISGLIRYEEGQEKVIPRMYLTANPMGVGLVWLKRIFVDRIPLEKELLPFRKNLIRKLINSGKINNATFNLKQDEDLESFIRKYGGDFKEYLSVEKWNKFNEMAIKNWIGEHFFIPATVYDNKYIVENDPNYITKLEQLDERQRQALLLGSWDVIDGAFFQEFDESKHVIEPFVIPSNWKIYRSRDYGLDKCAVIWAAIDEEGFWYIFRTFGQERLIVSDSVKMIDSLTLENEVIANDICPPDMWNKNSQTGKSSADILMEMGQIPTKANNDRINGWLLVKEWLKMYARADGSKVPKLRIFNTCHELIENLKYIQIDEKNPNDCAKTPHSITHFPDALRYLATSYTYKPDKVVDVEVKEFSYSEFAVGKYDKKEELITIGGWLE